MKVEPVSSLFPGVPMIMRDTTTPEKMPVDGSYRGVMPYADGTYEWSQDQVDRFIKAGMIVNRITVTGNPRAGRIVDCERGCVSPAGAARFVFTRNFMRGDATAYCNASTVPALVDAIGTREHCWLWVASWTGVPHVPVLELPPNIVLCAVQFATLPNRWDTTAVYSRSWLGR